MINKKFWKNKKVLVTGHTGFKGSWLVIWLKILGAKVYGYSLKPKTNPSLYKLSKIDKIINRSYIKDIRDINSLKRVINSVKPSIVFHLAAQPSVRYSYKKPIETIETNILGSTNLLEISKKNKNIKAIVMIATDKVYKNDEKKISFNENHPLGGNDVYSASKASSELILNAYIYSFYKDKKIRLASARSGNVIGGGDWTKDRIVPDCMNAFSKNKNLIIRYPEAIRPWQHVLEPLYGYLLLAQKIYQSDGKKYVGSWNFGPKVQNNKRVIDLVKKLKKHMKSNSTIEIVKEKNFLESKFLLLNSSKSLKFLKWKKYLSFNKTIKLTVDWYNDYFKKNNMQDTCKKQINHFMKLLNKN